MEVGKSKTNGPAPVITAAPTMDLQPITDRIALDIHRELKDVERRKKNVIVAGLRSRRRLTVTNVMPLSSNSCVRTLTCSVSQWS